MIPLRQTISPPVKLTIVPRGAVTGASGMVQSLLDLAKAATGSDPMRTMILRCLIGASVFSATALLAVGSAQANPIDDCNQSDDAEKQIDGCTEFLQLDPFSPYIALAYGRRAEAYMRKGDLARAVADFDQAVAIDGSQARLYVGRGLAYRDQGKLDKAIGDFREAIGLESQV